MKIPVFCSLIPTELLIHLGYEPYYLSADELTLERPQEYHCAFHENLCSYSKSLYDYLVRRHEEFGLVIIPTSCDAMKKLYNALSLQVPEEKLHLLEFPQTKGKAAESFLARQFSRLIKKAASVSERKWSGLPSSARLLSPWQSIDLHDSGTSAGLPHSAQNHAVPASARNDRKLQRIGILGANVPLKPIESCLTKFGFEAVFLNHCLTKTYPDDHLLAQLEQGYLGDYVHLFLGKNSCPRTDDYKYKALLKKRITGEKIKGLIVNTLKFCDFHPFDFRYLKKELGPNFPLLLIEYELTSSFEGQTMTRVEAFLEKIQRRSPRKAGAAPALPQGKYFVGIDSGSHATKLVCIDKDKNILSRLVVPTGTSVRESAESLLQDLEDERGIRRGDIARLVATGYGRNSVEDADDVVTEISCHALGAHYVLGRPATIIDIGGQDSKVIKIDEGGDVVRFAMNDKCAAGTGRFLEVMAAKLEMSLDEFAELAWRAKKPVSISSMCSVFAESEVISLIASGNSKEEIAKGIHRAIAERTIALARRIDGEPPYYMTGGVAKNWGLVRELENCLGIKIAALDSPQFSGALGAAIIALGGVDGSAE